MAEHRTLWTALGAALDREPAHPVVAGRDGLVSGARLRDAVERMAGRLTHSGLRRGSTVALVLPNGAEFVASFFAVTAAGAIAVPVNPTLAPAEIAAIVRDASVSIILAAPPASARCRAAADLARAAGGAALVLEAVSLATPGGPGPTRPPALSPNPDDPALCLYSSGSTGRPKRVLRSHAHLLAETDRLVTALGLGASDRVLGVVPFSHVNGLVRSMLASLLAGATLVPMADFERHGVAQTIDAQAISVMVGVPFMFSVLADTRWPRAVHFRSLRFCASASAPLPPRVSQRFHARYGIHVRQLYGTTETGTIAVNLDSDPVPFLASVGTPLPGVEVRVLAESGVPLPPGETGQVAIRSPAAATGYADQPDATAAAFARGYFYPGDVGWMDPGGRLYLTGRTSLFINRGGFKVNPYEVEDVLQQHPKVAEVAVVGETAPLGDQRVKAIVVASEPCEPSELVDFCRDRLAEYKVPSLIEFWAELPKSATGKTMRAML